MPENRHPVSLLVLLALLAATARFTGIGFGLPHTLCRPDESTIVDAARLVFGGEPNPHYFHYPSLLIYLLAGLARLHAFFLMALGRSPAEAVRSVEAQTAGWFLLSRAISALTGSLTVLPVFFVTREWFGRRAALLAALFLSLAYLHARDSHFGTTDAASTFLILCAVYAMVRAHRLRTVRPYLTAGLLTGLAVGTKYGAVFLFVAMGAAHFLGRRDFLPSLADRKIWIYALSAVLVFVLVTPFAVLDARTFFSHFAFESRHLAEGHLAGGAVLRLGRGWWYHARYSLPLGLGLGLFFSSLAGLALVTVTRPRTAILLWAFPVAYYAVAGRGHTVFLRYMVPVVPFLCIAAAVWIERLAGWMRRILPPGLALALLATLALVEPVYRIVRFDLLLLRKDNRLVAAEWMARHLPAGATVCQTGYGFGQLALPPGLVPFRRGSPAPDRLPDYLIVQEHPLPHSAVPAYLRDLLADRYARVQRFEAVDLARSNGWYDRLDAFYVPYAGFRGVYRPGPNLDLYAVTHANR